MTTPDDLTVLCTGDLHLGRRPTRVPEELDGRQFSPAAVWEATVDEAIERDADAVLVGGDVVDRENRYVEAYGDFERGATRLADADVPLLAVAGNHDHDTLPDLIAGLDRDEIELLGADGGWERRTIRRHGETLFHVDGWSFPSEHVFSNPLEEYDPDALAADAAGSTVRAGDDAPADGDAPAAGLDATAAELDAPVVGLLHADLDARDSDYAPVTTADLRHQPADAWVLGHVHAPSVRVDGDPTVLYPGSPQPLDPGEPGAHGPWLLTSDGPAGTARSGGSFTVEQLPLATLRYDALAVDVGDAEAPADVTPAVHDRLEEHLREDVRGSRLELVLADVRLTGRTAIHAELADERTAIEAQLGLRREGLAVRIDRLRLDTRPAVDLASLAGDETPVAYLAELLLELEGDDGDRDGDGANGGDGTGAAEFDDRRTNLGDRHASLVDDALERLREAYGASAYSRLHQEGRIDQPDRSEAVETLRRQARLLLHELLEQRAERR